MKMRQANRTGPVRETGDRALREFLLGRDSMEMRGRESLPEHQHHRRNECDVA